jgi:hypothetical protein
MKKGRFKGINNMPADYYWYSWKGKKNKKRGIQEMEIWLAEIIPQIDFVEDFIKASWPEVLFFKLWIKPKNIWLSLNIEHKIAIIGIIILAAGLFR